MLSSQMLWPASWSSRVAFMLPPLPAPHRARGDRRGADRQYARSSSRPAGTWRAPSSGSSEDVDAAGRMADEHELGGAEEEARVDDPGDRAQRRLERARCPTVQRRAGRAIERQVAVLGDQ